jgi:hypothetical protein
MYSYFSAREIALSSEQKYLLSLIDEYRQNSTITTFVLDNATLKSHTSPRETSQTERDKGEKDTAKFSHSGLSDYHWLFLHYHKTGHDLAREILAPICSYLSKRLSDNAGPRRQLWSPDDSGYIPYFHSAINVQGGAEMHFDWNRIIHFPYKVVHFVRDPYDYVISAYLYHSQQPPPPEKFVRQRKYNPCLVSNPLLGHYIDELNAFGENAVKLSFLLNETESLCRQIFRSGPFHKELIRLSNVSPNAKDALLLEAARSLISDERDAGADLLRMAVNALREKEAGKRAKRVFLSG